MYIYISLSLSPSFFSLVTCRSLYFNPHGVSEHSSVFLLQQINDKSLVSIQEEVSSPADGAIAVVEDAARWKNDRSCVRSISNVNDDGSDGCDDRHRKIDDNDDEGLLKLSLSDVQRTRRRGEGGEGGAGVADGGRGRKTGA